MKFRWVTIGFSTSRSWGPFSALIRWWWSTSYSHVYIKWDTPWGFSEVLEASGIDVRMREYEAWAKDNKVIREYAYALTEEEFGRVMRELKPLMGKPYGWIQVLGIATAELLKLERNPLADGSRSFVCSEIGYKFLKVLGYKMEGLRPDLVTPKDLKDILDGT